ncbi:phosphate ABC transporter permease subunit PstC [Kitasatospora sp. NBC_01287]|uniref:phosphate ABC transporter permease subunit PstC n=1 Tax=Kitasatospora sp. NBC_01287 TaxID=2903573 RepID=UPI00225C428B|nr:phosphate ABC transporter permease subunit PstC [Kitasatospora sp. NBC_01287]MCX4747417.1 phosphate ABC transporter permease subunit PstC [Kitasatospora sp. NBC_01287]
MTSSPPPDYTKSGPPASASPTQGDRPEDTSSQRPAPTQEPRTSSLKGNSRFGDGLFFGLSAGSGILLLVIMGAIAAFLVWRSGNAISKDQTNFLTTFGWDPDNLLKPSFGIAVLAFGTIASAAIAMLIAVPVAIGIALFISHYAPRRIAQPFAYLVDLLAAVPSIVYGLWGALYLVPHMAGLNSWLNEYLGWTYLFKVSHPGAPARNLFTVGILLAIMVLPIITAVSREVFRQVPRMHEEAALALGATRWEMIRTAVIPFGRPGIISASMLGLGRALGETIAVATVLSTSDVLSLHLLDAGGGTFAQNIALKYGEAGKVGTDALMASGLVLFVITLLVNGTARLIIARRKEYSGANA